MVDASNGATSQKDISDTASDLASMTDASPEELAAYYDKWATSYEKDLLDMGYEAPTRAATFMAQQNIPKDSPILDAGCGTGLTGLELAKQGYRHITGIDISPESLKQAKAKDCYTLLKIQNMNQQLDFDDNSFAAAQCIGALTYVRHIEGLMRELVRLVKPGGIITFTHRTDLYDTAFADLMQKLTSETLWEQVHHSPPSPYIPRHSDFGDSKLIYYDVYRVQAD